MIGGSWHTLVVGGYGYGNLGDEAILAGLLTRIGVEGTTVVSRNPVETRRLHRVAAVDHAAAVGALRRHRAVLIGGGGLFGADMGHVGRMLPLFGIGAATLGRPVTVEGVDIDDALDPAARWLVPALLRRATRITVRDQGSQAVAERMGAQADVVADLSTLMAPASPGTGRAWLATSGVDVSRPLVGLALTGVRHEMVPWVIESCAEAMDALPDVEFCFIPMSRHPTVADHDDMRLGRLLRSVRPRLRIVEEQTHPATVLAAYGQLSAVVAMRYHGMLFADRMKVPLVPMIYAPKNRRWLTERGLEAVAPSPAAVPGAVRAALEARASVPLVTVAW